MTVDSLTYSQYSQFHMRGTAPQPRRPAEPQHVVGDACVQPWQDQEDAAEPTRTLPTQQSWPRIFPGL